MTALALDVTDVGGTTVVRPTGLLDLTTYRTLRDGLLKCAANGPIAIVVRLDDGFTCATPAFMSVFSTVWLRVSEWPGVQVMLVAESDRHRRVLDNASGLVPRFTVLDTALNAVRLPPDRRRDETRLPATLVAALMARQFVRDACERWQVERLVDNAVIVATELVENAVRHAHSEPLLRVELRGGMLTIAVRDESPEPPEEITADCRRPGGQGITMVSRVSRVWGHTPWPSGGKVVWAVLDH